MLIFYILVLRLIHIVASVGWAGGSAIFFLFVEPTAKALAPDGMQFVQYMVTKRRFSIFMVVSSILTVLSGALLLWQDGSGRWLTWLQTGPGLGFTLGSVVGTVAFFVGMFGVNPRAKRMAEIGQSIQGAPTPEQAAEMHRLDREMSKFSYIDFVLIVISLVLMASARFWLF